MKSSRATEGYLPTSLLEVPEGFRHSETHIALDRDFVTELTEAAAKYQLFPFQVLIGLASGGLLQIKSPVWLDIEEILRPTNPFELDDE